MRVSLHLWTLPVISAIGRLGRTEDVRLSPSGRRLAIAGYLANRVLVVDLHVDLDGAAPRIVLSGGLEVSSRSFDHPHGVCWLDDRTLIVANRFADIGIFELPGNGVSGAITRDPVRTIGADRRDLVKTPGSISAFPIGLGLVELLVCNNFVHHVSRHLIDRRVSYWCTRAKACSPPGCGYRTGLRTAAPGAGSPSAVIMGTACSSFATSTRSTSAAGRTVCCAASVSNT